MITKIVISETQLTLMSPKQENILIKIRSVNQVMNLNIFLLIKTILFFY